MEHVGEANISVLCKIGNEIYINIDRPTLNLFVHN